MTAEIWLGAAGLLLGSAGLFTLIQFLISRHDKKHDRLGKIEKKLDKTEADSVRMQLLFLITQMPDAHQEILTVGEHYFGELHRNWYMTSLFRRWCQKEKLAEPVWFKVEEEHDGRN